MARRFPNILPFFLVAVFCLSVALVHVGFQLDVETEVFRSLPFQTEIQYPNRPWFMRGGALRPTEVGASSQLWPHESGEDRIVNQLMYVPPSYNRNSTPSKRILLWQGRRGWSDLQMGRSVFLRDMCPVDSCEIGTDRKQPADLVLFKDRFAVADIKRTPSQIWMMFLLECPFHTQSFAGAVGLFNWTASYRHDSDLVAPYEKWVPYDEPFQPSDRNYAAGKTSKVAWFVSNCVARNRRLQYARELQNHITVDMFGKCGRGGNNRRCPKGPRCFQMLSRDYKFYLAFENANCRDYVTEKFFVNGLGHNVIPIVMGARREDYARVAPPHSYIHVDDFKSPAHLAEYLHSIDQNDTLFNSYFQWKYTGEFINTRFWCRLCALLHAPVVPKVYTDIETWWAGRGTCTAGDWKRQAEVNPTS